MKLPYELSETARVFALDSYVYLNVQPLITTVENPMNRFLLRSEAQFLLKTVSVILVFEFIIEMAFFVDVLFSKRHALIELL